MDDREATGEEEKDGSVWRARTRARAYVAAPALTVSRPRARAPTYSNQFTCHISGRRPPSWAREDPASQAEAETRLRHFGLLARP